MFLTLEDPRAQIKGSRDPLGVQPLWSAFGRHLVGNLTTVTTSVRNFTVHLIGRYLGQRLVEEDRASEKDVLDVFLRWEQIAGYVRHVVHEAGGDVRGIERIRKRVGESDKGTVPIGLDTTALILSDQKTYGLWGLYTVSARVTGFLPEGPIGVSPATRDFIESAYVPRLRPALPRLLDLVREGGDLPIRSGSPVLTAVGRALEPTLAEEEIAFYGHWLRDGLGAKGGPAPGRQARLARLMTLSPPESELVGRIDVMGLTNAARDEDEGLAHRLERILALEALLAPAEALFDLVVARRNQPVNDMGRKTAERWGGAVPDLHPEAFADLWSEIEATVGPQQAASIARVQTALSSGDYAGAIRALTEWNAAVMQGRGGAPWVRIEKDRLDVRYAGPERLFPTTDQLPTLWRNTYFLDSLRQISFALREGRA